MERRRAGNHVSHLVGVVVALAGCTRSDENFRTFNPTDEKVASIPNAGVSESIQAAENAAQVDHKTIITPGVADETGTSRQKGPESSTDTVAPDNQAPPVVAQRPSEIIVPPAPPVTETIPSAITRKIELLVPERSFQVVGPEEAVRVSFDDLDLLKVLNAEPVPLNIEEYMPPWMLALSGTRIRIRGFMYPPQAESDLEGFMMVRDSKDCCFGRNVLIYDKIGVKMREGTTTHYINLRPFDVVGVMSVKARVLDGKLVFLYMINDAVVIEG